MNFSLRQLRAVVAIEATGSLTAAAERLGISQSAVSGLLRSLEQDLQIRLFERSTRRLEITPAGRAVLPLAREIVHRADRFGIVVRAAAEQDEAHLSFAATAALAAGLAPALISSFAVSHPHIQVRLIDVAPEALAEPVLSGEAAFSLGTPLRPPREIAIERLAVDEVSLATWPEGPFARAESVTWSALTDVPTISVIPGGGIRELIDAELAAHGQKFHPARETRFLATALGLARERLGVLVLPARLVAASGLPLRIVPLREPTVRRQISVLRRAGQAHAPAARAFLESARRRLAGEVTSI